MTSNDTNGCSGGISRPFFFPCMFLSINKYFPSLVPRPFFLVSLFFFFLIFF